MPVPCEASKLFPVIGAYQSSALIDLVRNLDQEGFLDTEGAKLVLKLKGWDRYWELKRGRSESKKAFMAMPFGNTQVDAAFAAFKTEVGKTAFLLYRLDESPSAGSIANRLRVEIRTSRFLVVDLTQDNRGAYWEAGFAEGLGKPVFYTCEESFFHRHGTHFDTNHMHTILWNSTNTKAGAEALKISIRATLPDEAKMND